MNESIEKLSTELQITPSLAKVLLHENQWCTSVIIEQFRGNASLLKNTVKKPAIGKKHGSRSYMCPVCVTTKGGDKFCNLDCGHSFCKDCWLTHFEIKINQGSSTSIGCMASNCDERVPEELVLNLLNKPVLRDKYQQFAFQDYVKSHPELRFCPGPNCQVSYKTTSYLSKSYYFLIG